MTADDLFESEPPASTNPSIRAHVRLYEHLRLDPSCDGDRAFVNERWKVFRGLGLADPDFVERFPLECGARIWEICLATALASWGWTLFTPKTRGHGPDLGVKIDGRTI